MNYVLYLDELKDYVNDFTYGCVGVDLKTGKLRYFHYFDENHQLNPNILHEFDINHIEDEFVKMAYANDGWRFESFSGINSEWKSCVPTAINEHLAYNKSKGLPVDQLMFNQKWLSIFGDYFLKSAGKYTSTNNRIEINTRNLNYLPKQLELEYFKDMLAHELGHAKVASLIVDGNVLQDRVGFANWKWKIERISISANEVLVKIGALLRECTHGEQVLEELVNERELVEMDENYSLSYPCFGSLLNYLCDSKLDMARYVDGIDVYYDQMMQLISSRDMADEVLETIYDDGNMYNPKYKKSIEGRTRVLLNKYIDAKRKR